MVIEDDLREIADYIKEFDIKNSKIVITGSTGLLGSLLVNGLLLANELYGLNNCVFALARDVKKARKLFNCNNKMLFIIKNEITEKIKISTDVDYVFHFASVTKSKEMVSNPVELIKTTVIGSLNVFDFAKERNVKSVVFASSMEVYGVLNEYDGTLDETKLGTLDLTNIRNCYPESKRLVENACSCYVNEYGVNIKVARLTQTFGAGADFDDSRIFGEIARDIIFKKNIILHTSGDSVHDYCYTTDAIYALLTIAIKGRAGETYNVANPNTNMSIKEMAELIADKFGEGKVRVIVEGDASKSGCYGSKSVIKLNIQKLKNLGWKPKYDLQDIFKRLIASFEDEINTK